ncbi:slit-like protein [Trichonephila clavipes]|nr:slit-like protein [Trichonephila clavipes]
MDELNLDQAHQDINKEEFQLESVRLQAFVAATDPAVKKNSLGNKSIIVCKDVTYEEDLTWVMKAARKHKILGVELQSVSFRYIPESAFNGTDIKFLEISNSSIFSLSEKEHAFKGLEDTLKVFKATNCVYASNWKWIQLERLNKLKVLEISSSNIVEIEDDFLKISNCPLENIDFRDNGIQYLPYKAFSTFKDLTRLTLDKNALTSVIRSMLPVPAKKLYSLGFSNNKIRELPPNMFSEMPALRYLYLEGNELQILDAQTFTPIWKKLKIAFFTASELRVSVTLEDKIIDIREKITSCTFFQNNEQFVKEMLDNIVDERKSLEIEALKKIEREDKFLADQRAFELEKLKL